MRTASARNGPSSGDGGRILRKRKELSITTFLLVHGAWHGAWCWQRLGLVLNDRGSVFATLELPSSSGVDASFDLDHDVRALCAVARDRGPLVLVAHSYAGAVVAEAATHIADIVGIVYVAALIPRIGQCASDVTREYGMRSALDNAITRDDSGFILLNRKSAALALYADCDASTQWWAIDQTSPQTLASFRSPRTSENTGVASTYVVCSRDDALSPKVQTGLAQGCDNIVTLNSDHSPFLSHPSQFADVLFSAPFLRA